MEVKRTRKWLIPGIAKEILAAVKIEAKWRLDGAVFKASVVVSLD